MRTKGKIEIINAYARNNCVETIYTIYVSNDIVLTADKTCNCNLNFSMKLTLKILGDGNSIRSRETARFIVQFSYVKRWKFRIFNNWKLHYKTMYAGASPTISLMFLFVEANVQLTSPLER